MDIALRAVVLYLFIVLVMRIIGRRELSSMSPFDLVLVIILGDAVQQGLTQDDYSVTGAMIAVSTIASMQVLTSYLSFRSEKARKVLEGHPIVLVERGKLVDENLRRERMTEDEVAEEMRAQQIGSLDEVEWAILEANGSVSFIKKR
ncbi:MAG TPA: YetF domain-containing protein [Gaiellaceae bacterium]|jgi:uncharacterized membrane protein YcaP (DUF421 family)|nr:YetF domain-containing protein [Gaiellaceae bacterium]